MPLDMFLEQFHINIALVLRKLAGQDPWEEFPESPRESLLPRHKQRVRLGIVQIEISKKKGLLSRRLWQRP